MPDVVNPHGVVVERVLGSCSAFEFLNVDIVFVVGVQTDGVAECERLIHGPSVALTCDGGDGVEITLIPLLPVLVLQSLVLLLTRHDAQEQDEGCYDIKRSFHKISFVR